MEFLDLHIAGFGKFHDFDLSFRPGMNVVFGDNEAGKSTIHTFLRAMLFGMTRARGVAAEHDLASRMKPWEKPEIYGGTLRIRADGCTWRIERDFYRGKNDFTLFNETENRAEKNPTEKLTALLGGITETGYVNSVSIGQLKSETDSGMIEEIRRYIDHMGASGDEALDVSAAKEKLEKEKSLLEARLDPDASKEYTSVLSDIRAMSKEIASPAYENRIPSLTAESEQTREKLRADTEDLNSLTAHIADAKKILADSGFTDRDSVEAVRTKAAGLWETREKCLAESGRKLWKFCMVLFFGLTAAALLATAQLYRTMTSPDGAAGTIRLPGGRGFIVGPGIAAAVCLVLAMAFYSHWKNLSDTAKRCGTELSALFKQYLGTDNLTAETRDAFNGRMDRFAVVCDEVNSLDRKSTAQKAALEDLAERQTLSRKELDAQRNTQWELDRKLGVLASRRERAGALEAILADNQKIREDIDAIALAVETLDSLSRSMRTSFGHLLNRAASDAVRGVTGGIYDSMDVDNDLNISLNNHGKMVPLEQVSGGTAQQIWLAVRLAASKILPDRDVVLPLIFDDSFVLYDRKRLASALQYLSGENRQILIFTCRKDEEELLTREKIEYRGIRL